MDADLGVLIALTHDAPVALFNIGRPPRAVDVVQGDRTVLHVRADTHLLGGSHQHGDMAGTGGREEPTLLSIVLRRVHETDQIGRHAPLDQFGLQLGVCIPPVRVGGTEVAEHQLEAAVHRGGLPGERVGEFGIARSAPGAHHLIRDHVKLRDAGRGVEADHSHV